MHVLAMQKLFLTICFEAPEILLNVLLVNWKLGRQSSPKKWIWSWIIFNSHLCLFCVTQFLWISYVDKDLVKLQMEVAKRNNEGIDSAPDPVYLCNISEWEVNRRMLIEYIKTGLPDHLLTWKLKYSITLMPNRWGDV